MRIRHLIMTLSGVALLSTLAVPAALAQDDVGTPDPTDRIEAAIERRCEEVPNTIARVEERIARLQGDADTPGSIAWVEKWVRILREYGFDDLADLLDDRIPLKRRALDLAEQWLDHLRDVQAYCDDVVGDGA